MYFWHLWTDLVVLYFKMLTKNVKWGYLSHTLGFKVTEGIKGTEAVLEAEDVTLVFMNQYGRFILQNVHKNI